jgi:hypothetical protein
MMRVFIYWAPVLCQWWEFLYTEHLPYANDENFYILSTLLTLYFSSPILYYNYYYLLSSPNTETFVASSMQKDASLVVCCFWGHQARYLHHLGWVQSVCPQCAGKCAPKVQNSWGSFCGSWGSQLKKNPSSTSPYLTSLSGWSGRQSILLVSDVGKMWWCCW